MSIDPYRIKPLNAVEAAQQGASFLSHFIIFDPEKVYHHEPRQLTELAKALAVENIADLVDYRPESIAYEWSIAYINEYVKGGGDRNILAMRIMNEPRVSGVIDNLNKEYERLKASIAAMVTALDQSQHYQGGDNELFEQVSMVYTSIKAREVSRVYIPGINHPEETVSSAAIRYATNEEFKKIAELALQDAVEQVMEDFRLGRSTINKGQYEKWHW